MIDDRTGAREDRCAAVASSAADWLSLAAAPTFAAMALLMGVHDSGTPEMLCAGAQPLSLLNGMVAMYLLMGAFHAGSWLKPIAGRGTSITRPALPRRVVRGGRQPPAGQQ